MLDFGLTLVTTFNSFSHLYLSTVFFGSIGQNLEYDILPVN